MFMVDRIVLVLFDEPKKMWKLNRDRSFRLEDQLHASDEIIQIRHMRQNIVSDQKICLLARSRQLSSRFGAKEFQQSWDSFLLCRASDILGRLNSQDRDAPGRKILQQVAVIAGDLN